MCGVVERLDHQGHDLRRLPEGRPTLLEPLREVAPGDVLGDDVAEAVVGPAHVVDRDDVRMVQPGEGAGLGQVRSDAHLTDDPLRVGHLDRHGAVELVILSQIDLAEATLAQQSDQPVPTDVRSHVRREVGIERNRG